ncbi:hypothetical protein LP123_13675 [Moraxella bovis]|uniref:Glutamate-5-semialdehyde dehydrogenase n=1 Tax=Moraxella bovis TaxID=476 RepID=A0AAX3EW41_MORBO|nr:hypothetical protein [Moraxella bovis]UYZ75888.1 hypothetical protein LP093_00665 [Moraxella bovis]UYZ78171.1 hypothetical protein LP115_13190 [Moraxella bovis]UYZ81057.1 hypothetical protein LP113_13820 [Moraxella bovis]UYZ86654.1 hypothetical protein LP094_13225 [Moraxella bovis]UYZ89651.1 hypothetical protein LP114_00665 [Moraxella bovis]
MTELATDLTTYMTEVGQKAKTASALFARADTKIKNHALICIKNQIIAHKDEILSANAKDVQNGKDKGLESALLDRLVISDKVFHGILSSLDDVIGLPDPIGEMSELTYRPSGIQLGSYEKRDGKTGIMGDVNFNFHGVYTKHLDGVKNTDDRLPNLQGSGRVRSLNEAMALSTQLKEIVTGYLNAKSKEEQLSMMNGLLKAWAKTDPEYQDYNKPILLSMSSSLKKER